MRSALCSNNNGALPGRTLFPSIGNRIGLKTKTKCRSALLDPTSHQALQQSSNVGNQNGISIPTASHCLIHTTCNRNPMHVQCEGKVSRQGFRTPGFQHMAGNLVTTAETLGMLGRRRLGTRCCIVPRRWVPHHEWRAEAGRECGCGLRDAHLSAGNLCVGA